MKKVMLEPIILESTNETPSVLLNKQTGEIKFSGKSLPEDVAKFYGPIQNWFHEYCLDPNPETVIDFSLDYFNSSSARVIVKILIETESIDNVKSKVHVNWYYDSNDEVMHDRGLELKSVLHLDFELKERF